MKPMELIDKRALMRTLKISDNCNGCEWEVGPLCGRANSFVDACEAICEAPVVMTFNPELTAARESNAGPVDLQAAVNAIEDFARFAAECENETCEKMARAIGSAIEDMAKIYLTQLMSKLDGPEGEETLKQEGGTK